MLNQLNISKRLGALIIISLLSLIVVIGFSTWNINKEAAISTQLNRSVELSTKLNWIANNIRHDLFRLVQGVDTKQVSWEEAQTSLKTLKTNLQTDWRAFLADLNEKESEFVNDVLGSEYPGVGKALNDLQKQFVAKDEIEFRNYISTDLPEKVDPFLNAVLASTSEQHLRSEDASEQLSNFQQSAKKTMMVIAAIGVTLLALISAVISRSITRPVRVLSETVEAISSGKTDVRTELKGSDELHDLGRALDGLLDDRVSASATTQQENDELNDSVMDLLEGVTDLSDRDLTVKLAVRSDITGTVADAINNMTDQTASVLSLVNNVAGEVDKASDTVDKQATTVTKVATAQRDVIEDTMKMLDGVSTNMESVSVIAAECNTAAGTASRMTDNAMETVQNTVKGMNETRELIQETGKRMKRLGERSNEISEVVDIINAIAERTHVLALNASMQAASAGEAGKGFAVVAEEVQKLAENARESTAEISSLVRNIQVDTGDTISTMDRTIANVVEGTRLAEEAGKTMTKTRKMTNELVTSIDKIATTSAQQVKASKGIQKQVSVVVERTRTTVEHLMSQLKQTKILRGHAEKLTEAVSLFKLPVASREEQSESSAQGSDNVKAAA